MKPQRSYGEYSAKFYINNGNLEIVNLPKGISLYRELVGGFKSEDPFFNLKKAVYLLQLFLLVV